MSLPTSCYTKHMQVCCDQYIQNAYTAGGTDTLKIAKHQIGWKIPFCEDHNNKMNTGTIKAKLHKSKIKSITESRHIYLFNSLCSQAKFNSHVQYVLVGVFVSKLKTTIVRKIYCSLFTCCFLSISGLLSYVYVFWAGTSCLPCNCNDSWNIYICPVLFTRIFPSVIQQWLFINVYNLEIIMNGCC